jgi:hypothetical protein
MKLNYLLIGSAVLAAIFGVVFIVAPATVMSIVGGMGNPIFAQVLGANFIGFAVLNYLARNATAGEAMRAILIANLISNALGLVLVLNAQLSSGGSWFGWLSIGIDLLLMLSFGYFLVMGPRGSLANAR